MILETSVQRAGRISFWVGVSSGLIAIILLLILFYCKAGPHDEGYGYVFLLMLFGTLISLASFLVGVILIFAVGLNITINSKRARGEDYEDGKDV